ncbi:hypothetical protein P3H15_54125, partial [Rhodococcus sp. T2V]|nr:hypothetical protein [Rhodococcus sp. T2V]
SGSELARLVRRLHGRRTGRSGATPLTALDTVHRSTLTPMPDGTTDVDAVVVRDGKNLKGRALGAVLGVFGTHVLGKPFDNTVKAIEARNTLPRTANNT